MYRIKDLVIDKEQKIIITIGTFLITAIIIGALINNNKTLAQAQSAPAVNITYDNNGNLTSDGEWTYSYDYKNQLISAANSQTTIEYGYDHNGNRVFKKNLATGQTTHYPNKYYETQGSITNKHIFANNQKVATVFYNNPNYQNNYKFTGKELDAETGLYYFGKRYYNPRIGRFMSQDTFQQYLGNPNEFKQKTGMDMEEYLANPQNLNSYSYVINNPINYTDKKGEIWDTILDVGFIAYDLYKVGEAAFIGGNVKSELANLGLDVGGAAVPFITGLGMARRTAQIVDKAGDASRVLNKTQDISSKYNWGKADTLGKHFRDHGADFGAKNAADYAKQASDFLVDSQKRGLPTKIDSEGIIRMYDSKTNTFGSYNSNGTTRTFFKPDPSQHGYSSNAEYWHYQNGNLVQQKGGGVWTP